MQRLLFVVIACLAQVLSAAELVGRGTISTPENELNSAFTPDGHTIYFTRTAGASGRFGVIMASKDLRAPAMTSFSGRYPNYDPFVSPDGSQLFFISNRDQRGFDIWVVDRTDSGWGAARNLGAPVNTEGDELYPAVASDGTLYYSSCGRRDSRGRCDLYRSRLRDGHYLEPENLGDAINTPASETDAYVSPDQSYLVFTAYGRPDAIGDGDLYVSFFRDGSWTTPRPLGTEINTSAREYCPIVSPDGKFLYFTSQHGFVDEPQPRALTDGEFRASSKSLNNGFGNVYRVPIAVIEKLR